MSSYAHLPYRRGVGVMLFNARGQVFVARRIDMTSEAWQMPQGGIDAGEDAEKAAYRELQEETGYTASDWCYLTTLHPCIGYSNERIVVYLATGLQLGAHKRDEDESLEVFTMTLAEALDAMHHGEITDGKTMIALFWAEKHLSGTWS